MSDEAPGVIDLVSHHSVAVTIDRLDAAVRARGMLVFARIDFSGDAARAGLAMRPAQMLLFGSPKAGTPLMVAAPRAALDLPLKALAWQSDDGRVHLSYNAPAYLAARHGLALELVRPLDGAAQLLQAAAAP
jgi:uncharacterized protein (DUF302 family)